jgi:hypothetical protein
MPVAEATRYARVLSEEAVKRAFDPLTGVAIIHFETRWRPGLVSPDGEDYGLGQIRGRFLSACRGDADPVGDPSEGCKAAKATLLVGETNIRRMAAIITANRGLCKEKTGNADLPRWLAGYEGLSSPARDRWCAPGPKTWRVVAYRQQLVADLVTKPALAAAAKAKPSEKKAGVVRVAERKPEHRGTQPRPRLRDAATP